MDRLWNPLETIENIYYFLPYFTLRDDMFKDDSNNINKVTSQKKSKHVDIGQ
jgi:hypothetical protein